MTRTLTLWRLFPEPLTPIPLSLPLTIGRLPTCDVRLDDDDVSRLHATIEVRGADLTLVDQGSRNGVYVSGRRIGVAALLPGSVIRMGQTLFWLGPSKTTRQWLPERIAHEATQSSALVVVGETGAGKRTVARQIHRQSGRPGPLLVADGRPDAPLFRAAAKGSVVCNVTEDFAELAREAMATDVRLFGLSAVAPAAHAGVSILGVPPLRERLDELPDVLRTFLARTPASGGPLYAPAPYNCDFLEALACHPFALNFRELEVVCAGLTPTPEGLGVQNLPNAVRAHLVEARSALSDDLSRERLHDALTRHRGNVRRVAQELGVQRGQLYRLLAGFGLNPDLYRGLVSPAMPPQPPREEREERRTLT